MIISKRLLSVRNAINSIYIKIWTTNRYGEKLSKKCNFIRYPDSHKHECEQHTLKSMKTPTGTTYLAPRKAYCYSSVIKSLEEIIFSIYRSFVSFGEIGRCPMIDYKTCTMAIFGNCFSKIPTDLCSL